MITLFIDSSRKTLSIALIQNDKVLSESNINSYSKHSNFLMNEIVNIISINNYDIKDIDNIVVLNGPGSFTGIRVGVTIAKTLAWALNKKLYQLSNLRALSLHSDINYKNIISVIHDKDNESYIGLYEYNNIIEDYLNIDNIEIHNNENTQIISFDDNKYIENIKNKFHNNEINIKIIDGYDYIKIIKYVMNDNDINPHLAEPIYLKKIDAEKVKKND